VTHHNEEKHHEHQAERAHEKKLEKERDDQEMKKPGGIHPAWFIGLGIVLIAGVLVVWILVW